MGDRELAEKLVRDVLESNPSEEVTDRERVLCDYASKLTTTPEKLQKEDIEKLRCAGLDDATILDLNQVVAYFAYANRTANGLGIELE